MYAKYHPYQSNIKYINNNEMMYSLGLIYVIV